MEGKIIFRNKYLNNRDSKSVNFMKNIESGPLTLDRNYNYLNANTAKTPFKEVSIIDWKKLFNIENINSFIDSNDRHKKPFLNLQKVIDTLYEYIYNVWDSSKFNLMFHSSGYDSRILSYLIKKVYDKKGVEIKY